MLAMDARMSGFVWLGGCCWRGGRGRRPGVCMLFSVLGTSGTYPEHPPHLLPVLDLFGLAKVVGDSFTKGLGDVGVPYLVPWPRGTKGSGSATRQPPWLRVAVTSTSDA